MRQQVNGAKISPSERVKNPFVSAMINRKKKKIVRALQNDIVFMFYFIFYSLDNEKKNVISRETHHFTSWRRCCFDFGFFSLDLSVYSKIILAF